MDDLVRHCIREISFDGDLGSNVFRLHDFVRDFYEKTPTHHQKLDDAFYAFVWPLIVQTPGVRIGKRPAGIVSEVYVPPQTSKAKDAEPVPPLELEDIPNAKERSLEDLRTQFGNDLRVAVHPEGVYAAITGSHIKPKAMSPMVYAALQVITRGRQNGVSIVDLGKQTGYDQKTCFYLVKKLTELDLVVKVRRGGVGSNFALHKYFFDNDPSWRAVREEEQNAGKATQAIPLQDMNAPQDATPAVLRFTPITEMHLSSLDLVKGRVIQKLQASLNHTHAANNLLIEIGFVNPTKTQRRFFTARVRELIQSGVIEAVKVLKSGGKWVKCYRLPPESEEEKLQDDVVVLEQKDNEEEEEENVYADDLQESIRMNITLQKQVMMLLEGSGMAGMTLNELSAKLLNFDRRILELFLERAEKRSPPSHLSDIGIYMTQEFYGRERRNRFFTIDNYRKLVQKEGLNEEQTNLSAMDLSSAGEFSTLVPTSFYKDDVDLHRHQDAIYDLMQDQTGSKKTKRAVKNSTLPDGSAKRGRVKKSGGKEVLPSTRTSTKRKRDEQDDLEDASISARPAKKVKGRQPRAATTTEKDAVDGASSATVPGNDDSVQTSLPPKRRGRPPKPAVDDVTPTAPKKRGRPPKNKDAQPVRSSKRKKLDAASRPGSPIQEADANASTPNARVINQPVTRSLEPEDELEQETESMVVDAPEASAGVPAAASEAEEQTASAPTAIASTGEEQEPTTSRHDASTVDYASPSAAATLVPIDPALLDDNAISRTLQTPQQSTSATSSVRPPGADSTSRRTIANVSHMRREKELLRVIQEMGGVVNVSSKELGEAHVRLIRTLTAAGEPTSAPPGTLVDKRTVTLTLSRLEADGLVKTVKTAVLTRTGATRPATVAYLAATPQDQLSAFLANLSENVPAQQPDQLKRIETPFEFSSAGGVGPRAAIPLQMMQKKRASDNVDERWTRNTDRAEQLWQFDDDYIRTVLLSEHTTAGQFYGYIAGKAARLRKLHLEMLRAFESPNQNTSIVSQEHRIVHLSYFYQDMPASVYLAVVAAIGFEEGLSEFLSSEHRRQTPVRDLPPQIHAGLQVGRARSRSRILELLLLLMDLGIVTPLQESTSAYPPPISIASSGEHPSAYISASLEGWTASKPTVAPQYWQFSATAPVYRWRDSKHSPPFLGNLSIVTSGDAAVFWQQLKDACLKDLTESMLVHPSKSHAPSSVHNASLGKSLCRVSSWNEHYVLTWFQQACIKHFARVRPTQSQGRSDIGDDLLRRLSYLVSAPQNVVEDYLNKAKNDLARDLNRVVRQKRRKATVEEQEERSAEDRAELAQRAAEARHHREEAWDAMMARVHPQALDAAAEPRVKKVRDRFLESSGKNLDKWEELIHAAIKDAEVAASTVLKTRKRAKQSRPMARIAQQPVAQTSALPPLVMNPQDKPVEEIIARQGPPLACTNPRRKRKDKDAESTANNGPVKYRRTRFPWDHDFEELARDAMVIIQARCRDLARLELAALDQVFPAVPRNTVRQRHAAIRDAPGNEAYLKRLEDKWHELWVKHRGTAELPDDDLQSASNFDLVKHIKFLRQHIDKNALRVGYVHDTTTVVIPASIGQLYDIWDVVEPAAAAPAWDFMWRGDGEEGREKSLGQLALTRGRDVPTLPTTDLRCLAESAMKMAMGTPNERYDPKAASHMLKCVGQEPVSEATKQLLSRGVLSKLIRDPTRDKPGRRLKISDLNQNALGGSVSIDTFQDAAALEDVISSQATENWREWPLLATDGDLATLLQLVSEGKVDFNIDTTNPQAARADVDWNSKKADDDQLETRIDVKFSTLSIREPLSAPPSPVLGAMEVDEVLTSAHGSTHDGDPACCRLTTLDGLIDCASCLDGELQTLLESVGDDTKELLSSTLYHILQAGNDGISKSSLANVAGAGNEMFICLQRLTEASIPLVFWTGYTKLVVVAARYLKHWSVLISEEPLRRVLPRRWIDITGNRMADVWDAAWRAVIGVIAFRPGINQAELRWRLRSVYDRQEVSEVLRCMQEEEFVRVLLPDGGRDPSQKAVAWLDDEEEKVALCFLDHSRHWYTV
ncbi:hypothetical protein HGRIS_007510 [Hohenbuehelia grisea]|uniref:B-block binding subunit of TFIIIC domain-containing protein n=1 Tax=Hohenbuehelia grisea TaxID=104357 RepID=A0ABR3J5F3_9AGAR